MRVLITVKPRMYRETLALALHRHRPEAELMLAPADSLDGEVATFAPDVLVRNDNDGAAEEYLDGIACRIEVLFSDGMDVRIVFDGQVREIKDMSVEDLLAAMDEVEAFISSEPKD